MIKVFITEDERVSRRILEKALTHWDYEITAFDNGNETWDSLQEGNIPDLLLLDWIMPGMDGLELCRRIRDSHELSSIYVLLVTARGRREDIIAGLQAGADDYLSKPYDMDELRARVKVGERVARMQKERLERATRHYVEQLEEAVVELRASRKRIVDVQEKLRKAIAEELHGPVQTQMLILSMKLDDARARLLNNPQAAQIELTQIAEELEDIRETQIRQISHRLHPSIISIGLGAALRSLRDKYEEWLPIDLDISSDVAERESYATSPIPPDIRLGLYRVAEEALANVIKHAHANTCSIRLYLGDSGKDLRLSIADDGRGFVPDSQYKGLGTVTMKDYLNAIEGALELDTAPGKGTRITVIVPTTALAQVPVVVS